MTFVLAMTHYLTLVLTVETVSDADDVDYDAANAAIDSIAMVVIAFLGLLRAIRVAKGVLFDIQPEQEDAPLQFTCRKGLGIDNLSDTAALKMTHFNWSQLHLYVAFDPEGQLEPMLDKLFFLTRHVYNGTPCCYLIHPEEVFLYTLCKLAMGQTQVQIVNMCIGGNTNW